MACSADAVRADYAVLGWVRARATPPVLVLDKLLLRLARGSCRKSVPRIGGFRAEIIVVESAHGLLEARFGVGLG